MHTFDDKTGLFHKEDQKMDFSVLPQMSAGVIHDRNDR
jgi:hypothetical protein